MTKLVNRCLVVGLTATVALLPQLAFAQDSEPEKKEGASVGGSATLVGGTSTEARAPGEDHPAGEAKEKEEEEGPLNIGVDLVIGFGATPIVSQVIPGASATTPSTTLNQSRINTESFILGGEYDITKSIAVGARLPFTYGNFSPPGLGSRATTAVGAFELEGAYTLKLNDKMKLIYALGVSLPTAQGDEVPKPEEIDRLQGQIIDQNNFDRFAVNRSASQSRGNEESALFEPKRLGFIPKVAFDYNANKILIQPYIKMENLISTVSGAEHSYIGELVFGTFLGYRVHEFFDAGARVWANVPFAGGGDTVAAVEPQIRGHIGNVMPILGGIIPFAGLTDPQFGGIRLAVAARF